MAKKNSHGMSSIKASAVKNSGHASEVAFNSLFGQKSTKEMNFLALALIVRFKKKFILIY